MNSYISNIEKILKWLKCDVILLIIIDMDDINEGEECGVFWIYNNYSMVYCYIVLCIDINESSFIMVIICVG